MPYPINPSHPNYSGNVIPYVFSKKVLQRFYDASIIPAISNTDYEGEIKNQGDKVIINRTPDITLTPYKMGDNLIHQRPVGTTLELLIDQGVYWDVILDDIADKQSQFDLLSQWADDASWKMKQYVDTNCFALMYASGDPLNSGANAGRISGNINLGQAGAPLVLNRDNVLDWIVDQGTVLDEQNIPNTSNKLVIPTWVGALIKKSDLRNASITGDSVSPLRNGRIGEIDSFEIYTSNLLPTAVDGGKKTSYAFALNNMALTFAAQLSKTETLRSESTFGDIMRGLLVFGRQVLHPEAMAVSYITAG